MRFSKGLIILVVAVFLGIASSFVESPFSALDRLSFNLHTGSLPGKEYGLQRKGSEGKKEYLNSLILACNTSKDYKRCYRDLVRLYMKQFDIKDMLLTLKRLEGNPEIFDKCHELTHYIGQEAYKSKGSIPGAYKQGEHVCYGGFFHGALEGYFIDRNLSMSQFSEESLGELILTICGTERDYSRPILYHECLHGIGHGLMFLTGMHLPQSLKLCDAFSDKVEAELCYGGVFMENSTSTTNPSHESRWVKKDDPMYPCNILEERYLELCYEYQSIYFVHLTSEGGENNWQEVINLCLQVPEKYQDGCFFIMGTNQPSIYTDLSQIRDNCGLIPSDLGRRECVKGVVVALSGWYIGDVSPMVSFCSLADEEYKEACYSQIGSSIGTWGLKRTEIEAICDQIEDSRSASWCKRNQEELKPRLL